MGVAVGYSRHPMLISEGIWAQGRGWAIAMPSRKRRVLGYNREGNPQEHVLLGSRSRVVLYLPRHATHTINTFEMHSAETQQGTSPNVQPPKQGAPRYASPPIIAAHRENMRIPVFFFPCSSLISTFSPSAFISSLRSCGEKQQPVKTNPQT